MDQSVWLPERSDSHAERQSLTQPEVCLATAPPLLSHGMAAQILLDQSLMLGIYLLFFLFRILFIAFGFHSPLQGEWTR